MGREENDREWKWKGSERRGKELGAEIRYTNSPPTNPESATANQG
jgi:hypothetical protein